MKRNKRIAIVPISKIKVLNSRQRSRGPFKELVKSIDKLGLKKPVTVSDYDRSGRYELVCGEGRIEAFKALGQTKIPAIIVNAPTIDCLLMGVIENIARRRHWPLELVGDVLRLSRNYDTNEIAAKVDLSIEHVRSILYLLKHGENSLIGAVERGLVPRTLAIQIAKASNAKLQGALLESYFNERHTSKEIATVRRIVEQRVRRAGIKATIKDERLSPVALARVYRQEAYRHKLVAFKADITHARLLFIVNALRILLAERMFVRLLRDQSLDNLPLPILRRISAISATS
jgi:ParB family chromosome partitioning protein